MVLAVLVVPVATSMDSRKELAVNNRGDHEATLRALRPTAETGDATAQYKLGFLYLRGQGGPQDDAKAVAWFRKAAEQGHVRAQYNLGIMHHIGIGARQNDGEAMEWFRRAAEQGHVEAKINLLFMREAGPYLAANEQPASVLEEVRNFAKKTDRHEAAMEQAAPARGNFRVQLSSIRAKELAEKEAVRLSRLHRAILGNLTIKLVRADLGQRGVFYRLRAGPIGDHASAKSICRKLSARKQGCMVAGR